MTTEPLTDDRLAEIGIRAAHLYEFVALLAEADQLAGQDVPALLAEVRRLQGQRKYLLGQLAKRDAESGAGDRALAEFLGSEPAAEEAGTRPCGHDDYHDPHEWADRPGMWCPGISITEDGGKR